MHGCHALTSRSGQDSPLTATCHLARISPRCRADNAVAGCQACMISTPSGFATGQ